MTVQGTDFSRQPTGHRHSIVERWFSKSERKSDPSAVVFHGAAMPFVLGPKHRRNANLPGDMLHGGGGNLAGIPWKAAQELKELK